MKRDRLAELDALRGIAALAVVLFHFTTWYGNKFAMHVHPAFSFWIGYCGVHLFFMISGFVIFMTIERTAKSMDFVVSRFSRLYPAYWAVLLINLFLVSPINWKQFMANSTMCSAWLGSAYVVPAFWTLTVELSFYAAVWLLFAAQKLQHVEAVGLLWLSLMALNERLGHLFHLHLPWFLEKSGLLTYGNLFFAGILFYKIKFGGNTVQRHICLLLCWVTQFLAAREYFPTPEMVAIYMGVFYLFCFDKLGFLKNPWLLFLGSISYSLYLVHENLGVRLLLFFDAFRMNFYLNLSIAMAVSIGLAYLITVLVEQPMLKFFRTSYQKATRVSFSLEKTISAIPLKEEGANEQGLESLQVVQKQGPGAV